MIPDARKGGSRKPGRRVAEKLGRLIARFGGGGF
jgi:hypothetical protein